MISTVDHDVAINLLASIRSVVTMALTEGAGYFIDLETPVIGPVVTTVIQDIGENIQIPDLGRVKSWVSGFLNVKGRDQVTYPKIVQRRKCESFVIQPNSALKLRCIQVLGSCHWAPPTSNDHPDYVQNNPYVHYMINVNNEVDKKTGVPILRSFTSEFDADIEHP